VSFILFYFIFGSTVARTQWQALYHLNHIPVFFLIFKKQGHILRCLSKELIFL
jgi:hypothetical protein